MITRDNYEPFFLDYLEGNLDENMIDRFLDFLEQNPDLKEELHLFENIHLPEEQVVFSEKEHLYKSAQEEKTAFEMKSVAFMEGDLKDDERKSFETYLSNHPELKKEYDLFSKTRLVADNQIEYQKKSKLYRKSGTTVVLTWVTRAAAVVAILWGINSLFRTENQIIAPVKTPEIVSVKPQPVVPDKKPEAVETKPVTVTVEKPAKKSGTKPLMQSQPMQIIPEQQPVAITNLTERDLNVLSKIKPILAKLETEPVEGQLAVYHSINTEKINDSRNVRNVEEYLASKAKKVGNDGLLSVRRIFRVGLTVASEISGERIAYTEKDGKISSIGFDSKLLAFSIPLQKK